LSIQFPDKEKLYRRTTAPVISMFRYAAVAASIIVTVGLIWWFVGTNSVDQTLVKTEANVTPEVNNTESINNLPQTDNENASVAKVNAANQVAFVVGRKPIAVESNEQNYTVEPPVEEDDKEFVVREQVAAPINIDQSRSNFSLDALQAAQARMNEISSTATPVYTSSPINTALLIEAAMDSEKQVPSRGLLRKISRTLLGEENEESDGKKYVQFAVFQIPVKQ
jgi:type IV secretory pathway ATPase VirB11/archaellum biosynthesis ATPase